METEAQAVGAMETEAAEGWGLVAAEEGLEMAVGVDLAKVAVKETVAKAGWGEEMAVVALVEAGLGVTVG